MEEQKNEEFIRNLAEDYKNILDEKEKKMKRLAKQHNALFKILCVVYSCFKQLDMAFSKMDYEGGLLTALHSMVEFGRAEVSGAIHTYLPEEDSDDEL